MYQLLIYTSLALAIQAEPITPEPATSTVPETLLLSTDLIQLHTQNGWSLPQPEPGPRPTRESTESPSLNADVIQPDPGPRPTRDESVILFETVAASTLVPVASSSESSIGLTSAASASLFSADLINQHTLMGWSLPQPGPEPRPTRQAPVPSSESTVATTSSSEPNIVTTKAVPSLFSADMTTNHILMGWSLPQPGVKPRPVRAARRVLPAHKAHGPRAVLPNGPYTSKGVIIRV